MVLKLMMLGSCQWLYEATELLFGVAHILTKILGLLKVKSLAIMCGG